MKKGWLIWMCFFSFYCQAQEPRAVWGSVIKLQKNRDVRGILGKTGDAFYLLHLPAQKKEKKLLIQKFSSQSLESVAQIEIELEETDDYKTLYEDLLLLNDRLVLFTSRYKRESRTHCAQALLLNQSLEKMGDWKEI